MSGTPVALLILLDPGVQFKAIKGDALGTDRDFREFRSYLGVKPVAVHAEIERRVAKADEAREQGRVVLHATTATAIGVAVIRVSRSDDAGAEASSLARRPRRCARPVCPLTTMDGMVKCYEAAYPMEKNCRYVAGFLPSQSSSASEPVRCVSSPLACAASSSALASLTKLSTLGSTPLRGLRIPSGAAASTPEMKR